MGKVNFQRYEERDLRGRWIDPQLRTSYFAPGWQRQEDPQIEVKVISHEEELACLCFSEPLSEVNWEADSLIYVSLGFMPSGGYAIQVEGVVQKENNIEISLALKSPGPEDFVTMALTCPFDLIKVSKDEANLGPGSRISLTGLNKELKTTII